jgi:hypothetical protein
MVQNIGRATAWFVLAAIIILSRSAQRSADNIYAP